MKYPALIVVALAALLAGLWFANQQSSSKAEISGFAFPSPKALEKVQLIDHNNETLQEDRFKGKWTFIYVGYTFCPDACPLTMTVLDQLYSTLQDEGTATSDVSMLLVSVDPHRDTPERLKSYVSHFNESFYGATGDAENIKHFANQVSAIYSVPEDKSDPDYLVDHSSSIILINPNASVHAVFTSPQQAESLAKDFKILKDRFS